MDFKQRVSTALRAGVDEKALLKLVHDGQSQSFGSREAYDILQEIWLELGFDQCTGGGEIQDRLEYVMEKIWYECPTGEPLA